MNARLLRFVSWSLLQAACMHKFLHLGVDFMFNFGIFQPSLRSCGPLLDKSVRMGTSIIALLARTRRIFSRSASHSAGFGFFGIPTGMAGPVIANGFRLRSTNLEVQPTSTPSNLRVRKK